MNSTAVMARAETEDVFDVGRSGRSSCPTPGSLGIPRAHLVGMSMGGMIAQTVAAREATAERVVAKEIASHLEGAVSIEA